MNVELIQIEAGARGVVPAYMVRNTKAGAVDCSRAAADAAGVTLEPDAWRWAYVSTPESGDLHEVHANPVAGSKLVALAEVPA